MILHILCYSNSTQDRCTAKSYGSSNKIVKNV